MKKYILTIDEGTTSLRVILYNTKKNKIVKLSRAFTSLITPQESWVEQDAEDIYNKTVECLKKVTSKIDLEDVYGLGITNQRETVVAWDKKTGKPLSNAIIWKCRRTVDYCKKLSKTRWAKIIQKKTGLIINSYFSASKMKWLLENNIAVQKAAKSNNLCLGTIESYLVYRLTQGEVFVTDVTNASRTMLFNIHTLKWDDQLLKLFKINKKFLPKIVDNDEIVGYTKVCGKAITIAGLIGDQQSSLLGQGRTKVGEVKHTYGTGCFMLANIGNKPIYSKNGLLTTIACRLNGKTTYCLEGSIFNGGSIMNMMIEKGVAKNHRQLSKMAMKVKTSDVLFIPAHNGLGAPYWKMDAKETFIGRTEATTNNQIAKAAYDALVLRTYDVFLAMERDLQIDITSLCVDGGQCRNKYLMSRQADILQIPISVFNLESTCMGAIVATSLATGALKNINEFKLSLKPIKVYHPKASINEIQPLLIKWQDTMHDYLRGKYEKGLH